MKLEYAGQNENNGLYPKKFGVIFFQPLLLDSKHGENGLNYTVFSQNKKSVAAGPPVTSVPVTHLDN